VGAVLGGAVAAESAEVGSRTGIQDQFEQAFTPGQLKDPSASGTSIRIPEH
jgi:hypothetical protein